MLNISNATARIFHRVHRTGEEIKNDLPNQIQQVIDSGAWKDVIDPITGKRFASVGQWLVSNYPSGPGVGQGQHAIAYEELIALCESNRKSLCKLLKDNRPARKNGRPTKEETVREPNRLPKPNPGTRQYIEERLKREFPKIWQDYLDGKYSSARQAGIAAGFVKDTHDPLMRLKSNWNKATKKQKREFMDWLKENN
jgi:hypothetical protein